MYLRGPFSKAIGSCRGKHAGLKRGCDLGCICTTWLAVMPQACIFNVQQEGKENVAYDLVNGDWK